jgi:hypothetical protein
MVERGDLVDFGHRQFHLRGKRYEMMRRDAAETVLNPMQMLYQQIPAARGVAEERSDFLGRFWINATALRRAAETLFRLLRFIVGGRGA